jgi:hypothetical protein
MANICTAYVTFQGNKTKLNTLLADFGLAIKQDRGFTLPCVGNPTDGYIFDADIEQTEDSLILSFWTRWAPINDSIGKICYHYKVDACYQYEELSNGIFGMSLHNPKESINYELEVDDVFGKSIEHLEKVMKEKFNL